MNVDSKKIDKSLFEINSIVNADDSNSYCAVEMELEFVRLLDFKVMLNSDQFNFYEQDLLLEEDKMGDD